jgi:hypothetical protein
MYCALREGTVDTAVIIGGSNAGKLAEASKNLGLDVYSVTTPGWKINKDSVDKAELLINQQISNAPPGTPVVIFGLDNSSFCGVTNDGNIAPMTKCVKNDSKYHAIGELVVAPERSMAHAVDQVNRIIEICGENPVFVISPMPRYIVGKCCGDTSHMTNFGEQNYVHTLIVDLEKQRRSLRAKLKGCTLIDSLELINGGRYTADKAESIINTGWNDDPVHPNTRSFAKMSLHLLDHLAGKKETNTCGPAPGGSRKRTRDQSEDDIPRDRTTNRSQQWWESRGNKKRYMGSQHFGLEEGNHSSMEDSYTRGGYQGRRPWQRGGGRGGPRGGSGGGGRDRDRGGSSRGGGDGGSNYGDRRGGGRRGYAYTSHTYY